MPPQQQVLSINRKSAVQIFHYTVVSIEAKQCGWPANNSTTKTGFICLVFLILAIERNKYFGGKAHP
ncbi:MAG TPA: hypothetical protein VGB71_13955 [Flavisolibacter sp.]|jgi:hypothetical protein